ncbi:MAG: asparaginyl-tRNA synthetase [Acidimicrobiaceae bacterium]|nr:asparaginyl-tRNA synthetase [Acidimicrobiaceae bacterium]
MSHTAVAAVLTDPASIGTVVTVKGWVRTRRQSKSEGGLSFIAVNDGSCFDSLQVVARGSLANYETDMTRITTGCSVVTTGQVVASAGAGQAVELLADSVEVVGWVDDPQTYPLAPKRHSFEYLRDVAHLRVRTNTFGAVMRVRHSLAMAIHRFFDERGYVWIHTPIITANDAEGAGAMFRVSTLDLVNGVATAPNGKADFSQDFFGRETFLTVSGQLNVESYCLAMSKVYTFGPTFRAENSHTTRHLAEFWMVEPEIAFADLSDNADLAEALLKYIFQAVLDERADDMAFFAERIDTDCIRRLESLIKADFERMDYTTAVAKLEQAVAGAVAFEYPVGWGLDLQAEHERYLTEQLVGRPVVVTDYPKEIKAFYMRLNDDGRTVAAMDVLAPGIGEIVGGSQREERLTVLDQRLDEVGLPRSAYGWYRDLRRYGTVPHAGFGLGFERTLLYITGMDNIRDVIPFPRTPNNADF